MKTKFAHINTFNAMPGNLELIAALQNVVSWEEANGNGMSRAANYSRNALARLAP